MFNIKMPVCHNSKFIYNIKNQYTVPFLFLFSIVLMQSDITEWYNMKIVEIKNSEKRMMNANFAHLCVDLDTVMIAIVYGNKRIAQHILRYNLADATVSCVTRMALFNCNVSRFLPQFMRVFKNIQHSLRHCFKFRKSYVKC